MLKTKRESLEAMIERDLDYLCDEYNAGYGQEDSNVDGSRWRVSMPVLVNVVLDTLDKEVRVVSNRGEILKKVPANLSGWYGLIEDMDEAMCAAKDSALRYEGESLMAKYDNRNSSLVSAFHTELGFR